VADTTCGPRAGVAVIDPAGVEAEAGSGRHRVGGPVAEGQCPAADVVVVKWVSRTAQLAPLLEEPLDAIDVPLRVGDGPAVAMVRYERSPSDGVSIVTTSWSRAVGSYRAVGTLLSPRRWRPEFPARDCPHKQHTMSCMALVNRDA
jgi:hypothetical protein